MSSTIIDYYLISNSLTFELPDVFTYTKINILLKSSHQVNVSSTIDKEKWLFHFLVHKAILPLTFILGIAKIYYLITFKAIVLVVERDCFNEVGLEMCNDITIMKS